MENSKIGWCDDTFNPWSGCTKVSPACKNCYAAESYSVKVRGVEWGPQAERRIAADSMWKQPLKWNRQAQAQGIRRRVFCASLADVFEAEDTMPETSVTAVLNARIRLFQLIDATPNLDWLLLTKRPENILPSLNEMMSAVKGRGWDLAEMPNVWLGTTVENQREANKRIPKLRYLPAAIRFLSMEPLLGPVDLGGLLTGIDWVIVGGESGPKARECDSNWIRDIVGQCKAAGVPVFVKQLGSRATWGVDFTFPFAFKDKKGGEISEWPKDLQIQEVPR